MIQAWQQQHRAWIRAWQQRPVPRRDTARWTALTHLILQLEQELDTMKTHDVFPSSYLKAADLNGRQITVTIESMDMRDLGDDKPKPVISFRGAEKELVLNRTNWNTIADVLRSDDSDDWIGKKITLIPAKTEFQGRRVDCIRVLDTAQPAPAPAPAPPAVDEDSIPF